MSTSDSSTASSVPVPLAYTPSMESVYRLGLPEKKEPRIKGEHAKFCLVCCDMRIAVMVLDVLYLIGAATLLIAITFVFEDYDNIQNQANYDPEDEEFNWFLAQMAQGDPLLRLSPTISQVLRIVSVAFGLFGAAMENEYWVVFAAGSFLLDFLRSLVNLHWLGLGLASFFLYPHVCYLQYIWQDRQDEHELERDGWCHV